MRAHSPSGILSVLLMLVTCLHLVPTSSASFPPLSSLAAFNTHTRRMMDTSSLQSNTDSTTLSSSTTPLLNEFSKPTAHITLDCQTTDTTYMLMQKAAQHYELLRPDLRIRITTIENTPTETASQILFNRMANGDADYGFSSFVPTEEQKEASPDLLHIAAAAFPFAPVYNLPTLQSPLVLDMKSLARIHAGNITRWNDPALVSLNPRSRLPNRGIIVVLMGESATYVKAATHSFRAADVEFAQLIEESGSPNWPYSRYHQYETVRGTDGPASYVHNNPYAIGLSLVHQANAHRASLALIQKADGTNVAATFGSVVAAFSEQVMLTSMLPDGTLVSEQSPYITDAPGVNSWPLLVQGTFSIAREYSRFSCEQRTELVKFLLFILNSDTVQFQIASELVTAVSSIELDASIGLRTALQTQMKCGGFSLNIGKSQSTTTTVGFAALESAQADVRKLLVEQYSTTDDTSSYELVQMDEKRQLDLLITPEKGSETDLAFIFPSTFRLLYPGVMEKTLFTETLSYFPASIAGVMPTHSLPPDVLASMKAMNALPLKIDMETLALVFLGAIDSWLHPTMLALNPKLATAFAAVPSISPRLTRVFFGTGLMSDAPVSAISNHFMMALNRTRAFKQSGASWTLPADWTSLMSTFDEKGIRYFLTKNEASMEEQVAYHVGSIGYKLINSDVPDPLIDFDIVRYSSNAQPITIKGNPASLQACADAAPIPSFEPLATVDFDALLETETLAAAKCWPIPILITSVLPTDLKSGALSQLTGSSANEAHMQRVVKSLCYRRSRVAAFLEFLNFHERANLASQQLGKQAFSFSSKWMQTIIESLYELKCLGKYMLYTPAVPWELASDVSNIVWATSAIGLLGVLAVTFLVIKYRRRTLIMAADLVLQMCQLLGLALLITSTMLFVLPATNELCSTISWTFTIGLTLVISPQTLKLLKVYQTVLQGRRKKSSTAVRKNELKTYVMYAIVAALLFIDVGLLIIAQQPSVASGLLTPETTLHTKSLEEYSYVTCAPSSASMPYAITMTSIKGVTLVIGSVVAVRIRHVSNAFGESTKISWSLWSATVSSIIILPLISLTGGAFGDLYVFLLTFYILWASLGSLGLLFGYKFVILSTEVYREYQEQQKASTLATTSAGHSSQTSSKQQSHTSTGTFTSSDLDVMYTSFVFPSIKAVKMNPFQMRRYLNALERELEKAKEVRAKYAKEGFVFAHREPVADKYLASNPHNLSVGIPGEKVKIQVNSIPDNTCSPALGAHQGWFTPIRDPTPPTSPISPVSPSGLPPASPNKPSAAANSLLTSSPIDRKRVPPRPPRSPYSGAVGTKASSLPSSRNTQPEPLSTGNCPIKVWSAVSSPVASVPASPAGNSKDSSRNSPEPIDLPAVSANTVTFRPTIEQGPTTPTKFSSNIRPPIHGILHIPAVMAASASASESVQRLRSLDAETQKKSSSKQSSPQRSPPPPHHRSSSLPVNPPVVRDRQSRSQTRSHKKSQPNTIVEAADESYEMSRASRSPSSHSHMLRVPHRDHP